MVVAGVGKTGDARKVGEDALAGTTGVELVGRKFAVDLTAFVLAAIVRTGSVHDFLLDLAH